MSYSFLLTRREGRVEYLTLNRPDVRNAFNEDLIAELTTWAERTGRERTARVVVLGGAGKMFSAGADVEWMSRMVGRSQEENFQDARAMARMFSALDSLPLPLVGRVHGAALGGGCGLAAVCDIVVAEDTAEFGFTEVKLGILPAVIAPYALAKIGPSAARELFLTGSRFSASRARDIGLVHAVVPAGELEATVDAFVNALLTSAPEAMAAAKRLIGEIRYLKTDQAVDLTARTIAERRVSAEGQEGLHAFLEKRKARWTGT
ncbi:MAG: enoyl-CoA hydratase/isomerase family protein [Acidobacteria bacterium]|nr:enoyl-CoA hydratase/isomerase family protein [Acidobacteriota bacterium]MBI3264375.1 enoyl-CoA hydratase/isomerase family protein [Acidobacteriota bacterium]